MPKLLRNPAFHLLLGALVAVVVVLFLRSRGPAVRTTTPVRIDLEQHVVASGRVWVPARVQVSAQIPGLVIAVGAIEGQRVQPGDLLVHLDDAEARANVSQAKAAVGQANARVEQLRKVGAIVATESLRQAQTNLERAESDLARARKLAAEGAIAPVDLDNATRELDRALAQKNSAQAQQMASAPMGADSRLALTALLQAQAQLAAAEVRLAQTQIKARHEGVVLTRSVEPGDVVQPAATMLVIAVDGAPEVVFQPDERNLAWMRLGQKALVSADAFPQEVLEGEVSYIAPSVDPQRGSVEMRVRVPGAPATWKPDMTVSVDLTVAKKDDALTVRSDAVRNITSARPYVFVVENGVIARRDVTVGIRGEGTVEIASGLSVDAQVVLPGVAIAAGQRVRARAEER